jgi:hypothetical protein
MQSIKTLGHQLGASLEAHAPFVPVVDLVQLCLRNRGALAKLTLAIVMHDPGHEGGSSILCGIMRLNPGPAWRVN